MTCAETDIGAGGRAQPGTHHQLSQQTAATAMELELFRHDLVQTSSSGKGTLVVRAAAALAVLRICMLLATASAPARHNAWTGAMHAGATHGRGEEATKGGSWRSDRRHAVLLGQEGGDTVGLQDSAVQLQGACRGGEHARWHAWCWHGQSASAHPPRDCICWRPKFSTVTSHAAA